MPSTSSALRTRRRPAGEVVLGVDTHRDVHMAAVLSVSGAVLATDEFPATAAGYRDLLKRARKWGTVRRAGVEGTGSYGASLSRYLLAQGIDVFDVNRMDRADRRRRGKSDPLDAQNAAQSVLSGRARARAPELFRTCAQFTGVCSREDAGEEPVVQATRITLGLLAHRIGQLSEQIRDVEARLTRLVERHAPQLLDVVGIGPDTAVALLITVGDNPERLDSEASFVALCGVSPVERSSGLRQYRRLNRGGDRQANAALHRIVFTRLRVDPRTQDYYERRIKEGKARREIVRCPKRYAAREVFHLVKQLQSAPCS
ncbi:transposase [Streptomyces chiangmaiensis]|uniref:Transposase n=1 Tax=Streptomyces chiangmaiensis TaxID=766497 RepID=A0ABU7FUQ8_9ACTN|nr:transposase [Streptomyces chiangmaiensis]MED7827635.1 transposase [Streptomyces chiangmaiensis]